MLDLSKNRYLKYRVLCTFQARLTKTFALSVHAIQSSASAAEDAEQRNPSRSWGCQFTGGETRIRTVDSIAGLPTTWAISPYEKGRNESGRKIMERATGFEPRDPNLGKVARTNCAKLREREE